MPGFHSNLHARLNCGTEMRAQRDRGDSCNDDTDSNPKVDLTVEHYSDDLDATILIASDKPNHGNDSYTIDDELEASGLVNVSLHETVDTSQLDYSSSSEDMSIGDHNDIIPSSSSSLSIQPSLSSSTFSSKTKIRQVLIRNSHVADSERAANDYHNTRQDDNNNNIDSSMNHRNNDDGILLNSTAEHVKLDGDGLLTTLNLEEEETHQDCFGIRIKKENYGLMLMFCSAILFAAMGVFVQMAHNTGVSAFELGFIRTSIQGVIILAAMYREKIPLREFLGPDECRIFVILRGLVGGSGFVTYYYTIANLPLGDAICLVSLYPIITVLFARLLLKEKISIYAALAIVLSAAGTILIAQPNFIFGDNNSDKNDNSDGNDGSQNQGGSQWGYLTAMYASCAGGMIFVFIRRAKAAHTLSLLFSWMVVGLVSSLTMSFVLADGISVPSSEGLGYILIMAFVGTAGHVLMNYAGKIAPSGLSAIMRSTDIVWAYVLQAFVFENTPNQVTIIGALLVVSSVFLIGFGRWISARSTMRQRRGGGSGGAHIRLQELVEEQKEERREQRITNGETVTQENDSGCCDNDNLKSNEVGRSKKYTVIEMEEMPI